jgi:hypothetical protein
VDYGQCSLPRNHNPDNHVPSDRRLNNPFNLRHNLSLIHLLVKVTNPYALLLSQTRRILRTNNLEANNPEEECPTQTVTNNNQLQ